MALWWCMHRTWRGHTSSDTTLTPAFAQWTNFRLSRKSACLRRTERTFDGMGRTCGQAGVQVKQKAATISSSSSCRALSSVEDRTSYKKDMIETQVYLAQHQELSLGAANGPGTIEIKCAMSEQKAMCNSKTPSSRWGGSIQLMRMWEYLPLARLLGLDLLTVRLNKWSFDWLSKKLVNKETIVNRSQRLWFDWLFTKLLVL